MSALSEGLVVAHLGKGIAVEVGEQTILCQTLRKLDTVVVGDRVMISHSAADQGRIEQRLPRRSVLQRPNPPRCCQYRHHFRGVRHRTRM
jgi:ribosome biogenesis GTPase